VAIIIAILAAIWLWSSRSESKQSNERSNSNSSIPSLFKNASPETEQATDTDGDGLSDEAEGSLGTNLESADTDGDALFDNEEVNVYRSDPKNPDSDADGFEDGDEVQRRFNPNGDGPLFDLTNSLPAQTNP
jgi:hypothetical protein